jgi:hypothetical protein
MLIMGLEILFTLKNHINFNIKNKIMEKNTSHKKKKIPKITIPEIAEESLQLHISK